MARFYGKVGYIETKETAPGVFSEEIITDRYYRGDVLKNTSRREAGNNLNDDLTLNNMFSIVADAFAYANYSSIRYVEWMGSLWKVTNVEIQRPRLILTIGGVYNG
jgi:hypothetical protein